MSGKQTNKEEQRLAALRRLAIVDSYGIDWEFMLKNADTDPQMARDVVLIVREYIREHADEVVE